MLFRFSILSLVSTIFLLDFGSVPVMWYTCSLFNFFIVYNNKSYLTRSKTSQKKLVKDSCLLPFSEAHTNKLYTF